MIDETLLKEMGWSNELIEAVRRVSDAFPTPKPDDEFDLDGFVRDYPPSVPPNRYIPE